MLTTARLALRRRVEGDADLVRALWLERDPRVPRHRRIGPDGRPTVADLAERIRREPTGPGQGLLTVVRRDPGDSRVPGEPLGYCGLLLGTRRPGEPELAYELLRASHGHGYATEAAGAVVAWARDAGHVRVWAGVREWNTPSRRVLEKLGFEVVEQEADVVHGDDLLTVRHLRRDGPDRRP